MDHFLPGYWIFNNVYLQKTRKKYFFISEQVLPPPGIIILYPTRRFHFSLFTSSPPTKKVEEGKEL